MTRDEAINTLWRTHDTGGIRFPCLFAVLDAAADARIYPKLVAMQDELEVACLFKGALAEQVAFLAPYLVRLDTNLKLFDWWWENGWEQDWGIFAWSSAAFSPLYDHFCHHTKALTEEQEMIIFRYWDPRVFSRVWGILDEEQKRQMLGPLQSISIIKHHSIMSYKI